MPLLSAYKNVVEAVPQGENAVYEFKISILACFQRGDGNSGGFKDVPAVDLNGLILSVACE